MTDEPEPDDALLDEEDNRFTSLPPLVPMSSMVAIHVVDQPFSVPGGGGDVGVCGADDG